MRMAALLVGIVALVPAVIVAFVPKNRDRRTVPGDRDASGLDEEQSYGAMNGTGWGGALATTTAVASERRRSRATESAWLNY